MPSVNSALGITEVVFRDAHQSLFATRMRIDDMLPIAAKLDQIGYWSMESWGGATFDSCIRFLGEDPWDRIREIKKAMPNTPQQMLFRGQNILGYRHYADDVVEKFVERAAFNGIDVFRVFDAMNDMRNLKQHCVQLSKSVSMLRVLFLIQLARCIPLTFGLILPDSLKMPARIQSVLKIWRGY